MAEGANKTTEGQKGYHQFVIWYKGNRFYLGVTKFVFDVTFEPIPQCKHRFFGVDLAWADIFRITVHKKKAAILIQTQQKRGKMYFRFEEDKDLLRFVYMCRERMADKLVEFRTENEIIFYNRNYCFNQKFYF